MSLGKISAALAGTVLTALSFTALTPLAHAFGVGVQPSTVEMTVKQGDRQRQVITIGNVHKSKTISLTMGLADWSLDKNGQLVLNPPGETERSASDWVRFSPASVTLKPETSQDVTVEISVPYKVQDKGDHRFALLATTLLPELNERGENSGVWNRYQLASLFYLTMNPSKSLPEITNVAVNEQDRSVITLDIQNEGDAHARLEGSVLVKDPSGEVVIESAVNAVVLDRAERTYHVRLQDADKLTAGTEYTIDFDVNNLYAPQNKFRSMDVFVAPIQYKMP